MFVRSAALTVATLILPVISANAAPSDCSKIDAAAAASILGVAKVQPFPPHESKAIPNNTPVTDCGYHDATIFGPTLMYQVYTPAPKDVDLIYSSQISGGHPNMQAFAPGVGVASAGWVGPDATGKVFRAIVNSRTAKNIFKVTVNGLPTADAARDAASKAARML